MERDPSGQGAEFATRKPQEKRETGGRFWILLVERKGIPVGKKANDGSSSQEGTQNPTVEPKWPDGGKVVRMEGSSGLFSLSFLSRRWRQAGGGVGDVRAHTHTHFTSLRQRWTHDERRRQFWSWGKLGRTWESSSGFLPIRAMFSGQGRGTTDETLTRPQSPEGHPLFHVCWTGPTLDGAEASMATRLLFFL